MVKEIDLEAGTRLKLKEIQSIELIPREGKDVALHIISVNDVHFHIHQHKTGTVRVSIHGMKSHGKIPELVAGEDRQVWHDNYCFDEITIFNAKGKVSKKTMKKATFSATDIQII